MIYLLYGQPASGKTTLGKLLSEYFDSPFFIDGDEFRSLFPMKTMAQAGGILTSKTQTQLVRI